MHLSGRLTGLYLVPLLSLSIMPQGCTTDDNTTAYYSGRVTRALDNGAVGGLAVKIYRVEESPSSLDFKPFLCGTPSPSPRCELLLETRTDEIGQYSFEIHQELGNYIQQGSYAGVFFFERSSRGDLRSLGWYELPRTWNVGLNEVVDLDLGFDPVATIENSGHIIWTDWNGEEASFEQLGIPVQISAVDSSGQALSMESEQLGSVPRGTDGEPMVSRRRMYLDHRLLKPGATTFQLIKPFPLRLHQNYDIGMFAPELFRVLSSATLHLKESPAPINKNLPCLVEFSAENPVEISPCSLNTTGVVEWGGFVPECGQPNVECLLMIDFEKAIDVDLMAQLDGPGIKLTELEYSKDNKHWQKLDAELHSMSYGDQTVEIYSINPPVRTRFIRSQNRDLPSSFFRTISVWEKSQ